METYVDLSEDIINYAMDSSDDYEQQKEICNDILYTFLGICTDYNSIDNLLDAYNYINNNF